MAEYIWIEENDEISDEDFMDILRIVRLWGQS